MEPELDPKTMEGDGYLSSLYYLLWWKDNVLLKPAHFNIPNTILFKFNIPIAWFFTNKHGRVKKKDKKKLNFVQIEKQFL
jgi:hypothetical protein